MEHFNGEFCRLCLSRISNKCFEILDVTRNINFLQLKLDFGDVIQNVLCNICLLKLKAALDFKLKCLSSDAYIRNNSYASFGESRPVDLRAIYTKEKGITLSDEQNVCRLCMQLVSHEFVSANELEIDMFQFHKYIPEINFDATDDLFICKLCLDTLINHNSFIKNCFEVEKIIENCCDENIIKRQSVTPHSNVYIKSEGNKQNKEAKTKIVNEEIQTNHEETEDKWNEACIKTEEIEIKDECSEEESMSSIPCPLQSEVQWYVCDICSYKSSWKSSLVRHMLTHKDSSEIQWYFCDVCSYKSSSTSGLKRHMLTHKDPSEIQWYVCKVCSFKSRRKSSLTSHMVQHKDSSEVQWYVCDVCSYKASQKSNFKRHQLTHKDSSEIKWHECQVCNQKFKQKLYLGRHMLTHKNPSEAKWYECDVCRFKSVHQSALKLHLLTHKDPSEVKWYECDICGYKSIHKSSLKSHLLKHRDSSEIQWYECHVCSYKSSRKSALKLHVLTHKDSFELQPYVCEICELKFKQKPYLQRHMLTHTDSSEIQWNVCEVCDCKFKRKSNLQNHVLTHKDSSELQ